MRGGVPGPPPAALRRLPPVRIRQTVDGRRALLVAIAAAFGVVWVYVALRAYLLAFTTDEAISFRIFHGFPHAAGRANNQLLNTVLMQWSQALFGESELALRLPNVLAFGLYAAGSLALLSTLRRRPAMLLGAALLLADPFLIDFFGLARGYGLSLGFVAVALGALARRSRGVLRPALICGCLVLAFYASFAALNVVLGILFAFVVESAVLLRRVGLRERITTVAPIALAVALFVPGIIRLEWLQRTHALFYGSRSGVVQSTVGSLLEGVDYRYSWSLVLREAGHVLVYGVPRPGWLIWPDVAVSALAVLACAWAAYAGVKRRRWGLAQQAALVLVVAIAATEIEAAALGTLYPVDRAALTYVLVFAAVVAGAVDELAAAAPRLAFRRSLALVAATCAAAAIVNVAVHANLSWTPTWRYDASSRQVIEDAIAYARAHPRAKPWRLRSSFGRSYALDYYRIRFDLTWLRPVSRRPIWSPGGDLFDVADADLGLLPSHTTLIARFPLTSSELRARRPARWRSYPIAGGASCICTRTRARREATARK